MGCCCNGFSKHCNPEDSDDESTSFEEEPAWWQERSFDSLYFAPGLFKSLRRIPIDLAQDIADEDSSPSAPTTSKSMYELATALPDAKDPDALEPVYTAFLPGITVESAYQQWTNEPWIMETNFIEDLQGFDFSRSSWLDGNRIPETSIRGVKFLMPVPEDIPSIARRFIDIPDAVEVRSLFRLRYRDGALHVVQQTITSSVPFSDSYRVQSTYAFTPAPGGITFRKWVECVWVKDVPSILSVLKGFISKKVLVKGTEGAHTMARILKAASV